MKANSGGGSLGGMVLTRAPQGLPALLHDSDHLEVPAGTSVAMIRERIRDLPLEVLVVADADGILVYAPLVGETHQVALDPFLGKLRDRNVIHNHPSSSPLSDDDIEAACHCDMASLEAVLATGGSLVLRRPPNGWPAKGSLLRAFGTGFDRATKQARGLGRNKIVKLYVKEINSALLRAFGSNGPRIEEVA
jgi:hypothetical protein